MPTKILHVLSQRPLLTGSGISLDALVREADKAGWEQAAAVGVPANDIPQIGGLSNERIFPLSFAPDDASTSPAPTLNFPVPGMSDVMPYPSSVWSRMSAQQLDQYRRAWHTHLDKIRGNFEPDLVHTNHLWLVSTLVREVFAAKPVVLTCHATGLRQLELCPHLKDEVINGCAGVDHFCVLRADHKQQLASILNIDPERITVTGAGYHEGLFHTSDHQTRRQTDLLYVGKYSAAKGLPWLLDAVADLHKKRPDIRLHIAGGGAGPEARALAQRMDAMAPVVSQHGQLNQTDLALLMRRCGICVLPSFYEGVPLVLVEAAACGCRIVATALPGVTEQLTPHLGNRLHLVSLPRLEDVDRPLAEDLPRFTTDLQTALARAMDSSDQTSAPDLSSFTWSGVSARIQNIWRQLLPQQRS